MRWLWIFLIGFVIGTLWGNAIIDYIYSNIAKVKAKLLGLNVYVSEEDYIKMVFLDKQLLLQLDIDEPVKAAILIPMNNTKFRYLYNVSESVVIDVFGKKNKLDIVIKHLTPIVP